MELATAKYLAGEYTRAKRQHPELPHPQLAEMVCTRVYLKDSSNVFEQSDIDDALTISTCKPVCEQLPIQDLT